jgi:homoserine kinase type II
MAVYTEVSDDELTAFLEAYELGAVLSFKGIAEGVENSNYVLQTERGQYILTLYEKRVARSDLPFFLGLLDHLAARGFPSAMPVKAKDGQALRELCGRPAAIVTFLPGLWPRKVLPFHCRELGAALARMHLATADFPARRENALSIAGWRKLVEACAPKADTVHAGLSKTIVNELLHLEDHWPSGLPAGVVHADLFPDNVFFQGEQLSGIIDFYFACNDFYAYELAVCVNAWCFETDGAFNATKARHMLQAYRKLRPFSEAELDALPTLARGAALRFLLTRLYDWINHPPGAFVKPKDPLEYLRKLRFHQRVKGAAAYGLR